MVSGTHRSGRTGFARSPAATSPPAAPRRAATVMLLRDTVDGPAVHMLRRRASMAFAGGAYAYPGGGVDAARRPARSAGRAPRWREWAGGSAWTRHRRRPSSARRSGRRTRRRASCSPGTTAGHGRRRHDGRRLGGGPGGPGRRELSFADFLDRRGLVLRSDLLGAWARWITPEFEPRRYDTWFFVAALPAGQRTRNASTEADRTVWIRPADAADRYDQGELLMMPPTIATLRALAPPCGTAADALTRRAARRTSTPVLADGPDGGRRAGPQLAGTRRVHQAHPAPGASAMTDAAALPGPAPRRRPLRPRHRSRGQRPRAQRLRDDPRRHQHLDRLRAGLRARRRHRPGTARRRPSARCHRHRRAGGQAGRADPAHPRTPRPRRGRGALRRADPDHASAPWTPRCGSATRVWPPAT